MTLVHAAPVRNIKTATGKKHNNGYAFAGNPTKA
jgi:hypothetical protein